MLSKSKRVSNGLRSVDKEQVFFYPHLIAYFLYKQRKNFCFLQQIVSNLTLSVYRESMAKLEESWLTVNWYIDSLFYKSGIMLGPNNSILREDVVFICIYRNRILKMSMMLGVPKVDSRLNKIVSCVEPKSLSDIMQHLGLKTEKNAMNVHLTLMIIRESVLKNDRIG